MLYVKLEIRISFIGKRDSIGYKHLKLIHALTDTSQLVDTFFSESNFFSESFSENFNYFVEVYIIASGGWWGTQGVKRLFNQKKISDIWTLKKSCTLKKKCQRVDLYPIIIFLMVPCEKIWIDSIYAKQLIMVQQQLIHPTLASCICVHQNRQCILWNTNSHISHTACRYLQNKRRIII